MYGVDVPEDEIEDEEGDGEKKTKKSKDSILKEVQIDSIFENTKQVIPQKKAGDTDDFDLDAFLNSTMPTSIKTTPAKQTTQETSTLSITHTCRVWVCMAQV